MSSLRSLVSRRWVQHLLVVAAVAALLLPNMGMGLYDPWETHYAETARRIDLDGDWITLRWHADSRLADQVNGRCRADPEECYFFSKPVFIFWLMAASFRLLGVSDLAARLPLTLVGMAGLFGIYWYLRRMLGLKAALLAVAVTATTPYYFLLSRQIMTDIAFVAPMTVALLALGYYLCFEEARRRHLYLFYALVGVATLAKGLLGFLLPGAIVFAFLLLSPRHFVQNLKRLDVGRGALVFLAVAGPWYGAVWAIHGDTWFDEFIMKHHFRRAGGGVHGERGSFDYFVEQLGYGLWPWVALVPLAVGSSLAGLKRRERRPVGRDGIVVFLLTWAVVAFAVFTASTTKFHHYIFPAVPAITILAAVALSRPLEGEPLGVVHRALVLAGGGLLAVTTPILVGSPHLFINLFIYNYDRNYPESEDARAWLGIAAGVFAVGLALLLGRRLLKPALACLAAGGVLAAAWTIHGYMMELEPTLSQRDAFEAWERLRQPDDRLYEWALRWRGEVWYSRDDCHEIPQDSIRAMRRELGRKGRAFIVTTSPNALDGRTRRLFGRGVEVVNERPDRYAMTLWEGPPEGSAERYVVRGVPDRARTVGARLGDAVELMAAEIRPTSISPGRTVEVVLYFRCQGHLRREWTVFVHGDHPTAGRRMRLLSDHPPADGLLPTTRWRPGQIIRDVAEIETRDDQEPGTYELFVGLFRDDEGRMPVESGPVDDEGRVPIGSLTVTP